MSRFLTATLPLLCMCAAASPLEAQVGVPPVPQAAPVAQAGVTPPPDYVLGVDDVLSVQVWDEEKMSARVVVRPDGKITLPLVNDIQAAGLTPEQLRAAVTAAASKFKEGANVMVRVDEIKSRIVIVIGEVNKVGPVAMGNPLRVLQVLGLAGGVTEFADKKNIRIIRQEDGKEVSYRFNLSDVEKGRNLGQNILLRPGDTVVVP